MDRSPHGCRLRQRLGPLCARLLVTDRVGGAVPSGESSRVHLPRCPALDVRYTPSLRAPLRAPYICTRLNS